MHSKKTSQLAHPWNGAVLEPTKTYDLNCLGASPIQGRFPPSSGSLVALSTKGAQQSRQLKVEKKQKRGLVKGWFWRMYLRSGFCGRLIFIHLQCWEVLLFVKIQPAVCIKSCALRTLYFVHRWRWIAKNGSTSQHWRCIKVSLPFWYRRSVSCTIVPVFWVRRSRFLYPRSSVQGNIRQNHPLGNHSFANRDKGDRIIRNFSGALTTRLPLPKGHRGTSKKFLAPS